jgi:UDPglucose 6-dehydrogenase
MKVTVIGAGYVGLVTATCFADLGNEVLCVEKLAYKLEKLRKGELPIYEPGLLEMMTRNIQAGRIRFSSDIGEGVDFSDVIFLCVATPQSDTGHADLSQVEYASRNIAQHMKSYKVLVEKSTVPVNTHQWVLKNLRRYAPKDVDFDVASNPEFLREGSAVKDFMNPDRIVVGVSGDRARSIFCELYAPLTAKGHELLITNPATAELIKHASNSFLAMKISYVNLVAELCEKSGADVEMVARGMGLDKRIGRFFLNAGIGYGGSCFPKDVKAFIRMGEDAGIDFGILKETEKVNTRARANFMEKIDNALWVSREKNIAVWGLAFKPQTDDIREAPAIDIVRKLAAAQANLRLFDPKAHETFSVVFPESAVIHYASDAYEAVKDADALIVVTEWEHFRNIDLDKVKSLMRLPIVLDGRNIYDPEVMRAKGFEYYCIGRA